MSRNRLPKEIRKVTTKTGETKFEIRASLVGTDGQRRQVKRRADTEGEARRILAESLGASASGAFVPRSVRTVEQACADWLAGRRGIRATTLTGYRCALAPVRTALGAVGVQKLTKSQVDGLVSDLLAGSGPELASGKARKKWSPRSANLMLVALAQVLESEQRQGHVARNVAALVEKVPGQRKEMRTFAPAELAKLTTAAQTERLGHAWLLALSGLRRGEISGLRWTDVDLDAGTLTIRNNRTSAAGVVSEGEPKTARSRRVLPLPPHLAAALRSARRQQKAERLALGVAYDGSGYVVVNEAGAPYHPDTISDLWTKFCATAKVRTLRLHDARHTCATVLHGQGVPLADISAWLGHADRAFTLRTYAHESDGGITAAANVLGTAFGSTWVNGG